MGLSLHYSTEAKQNEYQGRTAGGFPVNRKCVEHLNGHFLTMKYVDDTCGTQLEGHCCYTAVITLCELC